MLLKMSSLYPIVEEFYSIQGEGFHSGRAAHFVRLAGCDVHCQWCDAKESWSRTNHPQLTADQIVERIKSSGAKYVVITGGEPLMHNLDELTAALHMAGVEIFLESSGSRAMSGDFDWVCISPKRHKPPTEENLLCASELKVVVSTTQDLEWGEECAAKVGENCLLYLQPEWSVAGEVTPLIVEDAKLNPHWMISIQTHKYMEIP